VTTIPETTHAEVDALGRYAFGWADSDVAGASAKRGLSEAVVRDISAKKNEPEWMLKMRLKGLRLFGKKPMPTWGSDLSGIDFANIKYFVRSTEKQATSWDELPEDIKNTYDRLGIPEAEKQRLIAGVAAQYESEVVYHQIREDLEEKGVLFLDTDTALREHEELFKEYFGTVIPVGDNKFAALNTAVWSGGSFIYVPPGVKVDIPLQAYFRINTENMGQFERTLIIADEGSSVHYVEGCTAPIYSSDSLHGRSRSGGDPAQEPGCSHPALRHGRGAGSPELARQRDDECEEAGVSAERRHQLQRGLASPEREEDGRGSVVLRLG
jgi:Fe-S cluster assembly protein SufB